MLLLEDGDSLPVWAQPPSPIKHPIEAANICPRLAPAIALYTLLKKFDDQRRVAVSTRGNPSAVLVDGGRPQIDHTMIRALARSFRAAGLSLDIAGDLPAAFNLNLAIADGAADLTR